MTEPGDNIDEAPPDVAAITRDLRTRVAARREAGEYPATLDTGLDHHYRAIVAGRRTQSSDREEMLTRFDEATGALADPQVRQLTDAFRAALAVLGDELPVGRGSMPERLDDLLDRILVIENALGAGPESIALLLERVHLLEDELTSLRAGTVTDPEP